MKLILLLVLIRSLVQCCSVNNTVCVRCSNGSLTADTWHQDCTESCDSIRECDYSSQVSVLIVLESGDHILSKSLQLHEKKHVKIQGSSPETRILCIDTGLLFINITDLHISNLTLENCSGVHHSVYHHANLTSAVFISAVESVTLLSILVVNSSGNGLSLFNIHGKIVVNNSIFRNNNIRNLNPNMVASNGGFYIEYNGCCLLYTSPSPRDATLSRMPSSA